MNDPCGTDQSPLHAAYFADTALFSSCHVIENVELARDTLRMRIDCREVAERIVPGQFVMVRLAGFDDPMLGRPFALYDVVLDSAGSPVALDFVYLVHGKLTTALARCGAGDRVEVWGPLGNGIRLPPAERVVLVAGGIGQTPFLALGKELLGAQRYGSPPRDSPRVESVVLCYGVRTAELLAGADDFRDAGLDLRVASDDGSVGRHGLVTELLVESLGESNRPTRVVCCGPEPMMAAAASVCAAAGAPCLVSLETPMACGIGICFSCVARVRQADGGWDYKRTCVEGPVFDAAEIEW